ncbi:phosphotransferase family protein [Vitreimonas sp.]|uniref:phosphotransferase family protein n=1 Tax=Vitreimonas sp. TaxID=3069702 RepID=UPI002ED7B078
MSTPSLDLDALAKLAPQLAPGATGVAETRQLSGGASQELWLVVLETPEGKLRTVLRRKPPMRAASELAIPIETEAQLIGLAHDAGVPSPRVLHTLSATDGLGAGFFMSFVEGEALGGRIVRDDAFAAVRPHLARQCGEILARIHKLPLASVSEFPMKDTARVIDELEQAYRAEDWPRPVFSLAFRWLRQNMLAPAAPAIVHGDFRNGNLLMGSEGVRAVLDWELAHAGDPMEDLGWICVNSWRFGVMDKPVGGFGAREDLFVGYEAVSGAKVDPERVRFWEIVGTLRWGVICTMSGVLLRGEGPFTIERPMIARRASETELDLLNLLEGAA